MRKSLMRTLFALFTLLATSLSAQTISDFENLTLPADSFWNGFSQPFGATFSSGNAAFYNYVGYDSMYAFYYWDKGWAYSNKEDSTTAGFGNQYSAITAEGYNGSSNYAVGKGNSILRLTGAAAGKIVAGFYVTNGTFPYLSMRDGDAFSKQFGSPNDANGNPDGTNGEDWFLLTIKKWHQGALSADSVNFYLADFRFSNNAQDYIVNTWEWVDLTALGNVDSLQFFLTSSDVGQFGMNTPAYFFMDHFTTNDIGVGVQPHPNLEFSVYPNPAAEVVTVSYSNVAGGNALLRLYDATGRALYSGNIADEKQQISVAHFPKGLYRAVITHDQFLTVRTFVKQ